MNSYLKQQYKDYLLEYLNTLPETQVKTDKKEFKCPVCNEEQALLYPNNKTHFYCNNPKCNFKGDVFDLIKKIKNSKFSDEDVADYLSHKFKIEVKDDINDLLKLYEKNNWAVFPLEPNSKIPQKGFKWADKDYRDPKIWRDWVDRDYGLAVKLGSASNIVAIDIDSDETYEKVKNLLPESTLIQDTKRGRHWVFVYEEDFSDIKHLNFRNKGYDMELRGNNAYIAIAPTSAKGEIRKWNNKKIQKMPQELKDFIFSLIDTNTKNVEEDIQEAIDKEELGTTIDGLEGRCNDTFVKMGGILRKKLNLENTKVALSVFNQALDNPMPDKDIRNILRQLDKYQTYDKEELSKEVLERLEIIKEATAFQIANTLKKEQKDVEDVLRHLEDEQKVINTKGRKYRVLENVKWTSEKEDLGVPVDFRVPYFHDIARFYQGGMIIIGSPTGRGKSHITGNIIKQLWEQKRVTHLINTEPEGGIGKITQTLKIPNEAYLVPEKHISHPTDIELVNNAITVVDWLRMKEGDYTQTSNTFAHFRSQLSKHKGFLIILTQIRKSNNEWFAPDQVEEFASLACKYLWGNDGTDGTNTSFLTTKIRDSKIGRQLVTVPTYFNEDTKILEIKK